ncbi:MAG TPA: C39 family peptidase [Anaerolineales bacterium]|nr:C39 family peptidase [Anaerolineales bacterium]
MRLWQKLILSVLSLTALVVLGGAATVIYAEQVIPSAPLRPEPTREAPAEGAAPTGAPSTGASSSAAAVPVVAVLQPHSVSPTPFQPLPITPTPSATPLPTQTPTPLPTTTPDPTSTPSEPDEVYIPGLWGHPQTFNLSCESRSASDFARYFGVYFTELEFLYALPLSDNPDTGFVGDVQGPLGQLPPLGYGVHARPVAALMRSFGLNATAHKGMALDQVRSELAAGRPVMIWAIRELSTSTPVDYTASDGDTTIVARFEHTFIVIGYGPGYITVLDNHRVYSVSTRQFQDSWGVLGNMGITIAP